MSGTANQSGPYTTAEAAAAAHMARSGEETGEGEGGGVRQEVSGEDIHRGAYF